mmetsp:Transcript_25176/g.37636  ORF Transcript_25176/g.37636 Transcript_25176/m.37636 type:complete len:153 (-) Transcript_25176:218-676(-)
MTLTSTQCWIVLFMIISVEVCGSVCMKLSNSYQRIVPSVLMYVFYAFSMGGFPYALQKIDLGTAYAVWSGVGTALTAIVGIVHFKESVSWSKVLGVLVIILGVILLNLSDDGDEGDGGGENGSVKEESSDFLLGDDEEGHVESGYGAVMGQP